MPQRPTEHGSRPNVKTQKILRLRFEAISSLSQGSNEVRVYHDEMLDCDRVGKRFDLGMVEATVLPEASTLQAIQHPNVLEVVSAANVDGYSDPLMKVVEIITPFYPRGSITDALLRGEWFSGSDVLSIMSNALRGIRELHMTHRILHRDLKSGNILLTDAPIYALVADIGVAGRMDEAGYALAVKNPTLYSPPELMTTGRLSVASDLYPLGHILRERLSGPFPYSNYSRDDVVESLTAGRNPLSAEDAALPVWAPAQLRRVHAKATALNSSKRYQSAREMGQALEKIRLADWRQLEETVWSVSSSVMTRASYRVEAKRNTEGYLLSIKKCLGSNLRRPRGVGDVQVEVLESKRARDFFNMANALALA